MNKLLTHPILTIINIGIVLYFAMLWLLNFYQIDFVLVNVFKELLTIPFLVAQPVILVIGGKFIFSNKLNVFSTLSWLALLVCFVIIIGSFFMN